MKRSLATAVAFGALGLAPSSALAQAFCGPAAAGPILCPGGSPCVIAQSQTLTGDCLIDLAGYDVTWTGAADVNVDGWDLDVVADSVITQLGHRFYDSTDVGAWFTMVTTGDQMLDGSIQFAGGGFDFGGDVELTVGGSLTAAGTLDVRGAWGGGTLTIDVTGPASFTGSLFGQGTDYDADGGELSVVGGSTCLFDPPTGNFSGRSDGSGGYIDANCAGRIDVTDVLDADGGWGGGDITLVSGADIETTATVHASSVNDAAGSISLAAAGDIRLLGRLTATGGNAYGYGYDGGTVYVDAQGSLDVQDTIDVSGPGPDGWGGWITLYSGTTTTVSALLEAQGGGSDNYGGTVEIAAGTSASLQADIDTSGSGWGGGSIAVAATDDIVVSGLLDAQARSNDGSGGSVWLWSDQGAVVLQGNVTAEGEGAGDNGWVTLEACDIDIQAGAAIDNARGASLYTPDIELVVHETGVVNGTLTADPAGEIRFNYRMAAPTVGGTVSPAAVLVQDPAILPCGVIGTGTGTGATGTGTGGLATGTGTGTGLATGTGTGGLATGTGTGATGTGTGGLATGSGSGTGGGTGTGTGVATGTGTGAAATGTGTGAAATGTGTGAVATGTGTGSGDSFPLGVGSDDNDKSGCGCATGQGGSLPAGALLLLGALVRRRRRL